MTTDATSMDPPTTAQCVRCHSAIEARDLRCPVCAQPTPSDAALLSKAAYAALLRCASCGAALAYDIEARAPRCGFCASVMHLEHPTDPIEDAEYYLPFTVSTPEAQAALRRWLGTLGWFHPANLATKAVIEQLLPLYWAGWSVKADATISWAADTTVGAEHADWAPHAGQHTLHFDGFVVSASRGLSVAEAQGLWPHYQLDTGVRAAPDDAQIQVERFDRPRVAARNQVLQAVYNSAVVTAEQHWIPGSTHRNVNAAVLLRHMATTRLALPAYVLAYRYNNTLFRTVVCGQNADIVIGNAPYSVWNMPPVMGILLMVLGVSITVVGWAICLGVLICWG